MLLYGINLYTYYNTKRDESKEPGEKKQGEMLQISQK